MGKNYKKVGRWWVNKDIELVEIDGKVYALSDWNGIEYSDCWVCTGINYMDSSQERYSVKPISEEVEVDKWDIISYEVNIR